MTFPATGGMPPSRPVSHRPAGRCALAACLAIGLAPWGHSAVCGTAGDELVAARAGLDREWIVQIPFDSAAWRLEHVTVGDGLVVAVAGDGGVHAVKSGAAEPGAPAAGSVLWSQHPRRSGGSVGAASIGSGLVTLTTDTVLTAVDSLTGRFAWEHGLDTAPAAGAAPVGRWVYAPLVSGYVTRLPSDPLARPVAAGTRPKAERGQAADGVGASPRDLETIPLDSGGLVAFTPVTYLEGAAWTTTEGRFIAILPHPDPRRHEWQRFEFDLGGTPTGEPRIVVTDNKGGRLASIFTATEAGVLTRIDQQISVDRKDPGRNLRRQLLTAWELRLGATPSGGPFIAGDTVVLALVERGIAAFAAGTGAPIWESPLAGRIVAVSAHRVWVLDDVGWLAGLDLTTGDVVARSCLGPFTLPVVNTVSDRLVLASPRGLVVSLAPRGPPPAPAAVASPAGEAPATEEPTEPGAGDAAPEEPAAEPNAGVTLETL